MNKNPSKSLSEHLRRLHTFTQSAEEKIREALTKTEQMGDQAEGVSARIDEAGGADLNEEVIACIVDLLITIRLVIIGNEELQEIFERSLANRVSNAITLAENWELLNKVDPRLIAAGISQVQDQETMDAAVTEVERHGGGAGLERLEWLAQALETALQAKRRRIYNKYLGLIARLPVGYLTEDEMKEFMTFPEGEIK